MANYAACPTCHAPMRVEQLSNGRGMTWAGFHCGASQQFEDDEVVATSNEVTKRAGNVVPKSGAPGKALLQEKDIPMKATSNSAKKLTVLAAVGKGDFNAPKKALAKKAAKADGHAKPNGKAKSAKAAKANGKPKQKLNVAKVLSPPWKKIFAELGKVDYLPVAELTKIAEKHGMKGWYERFRRGGIIAKEGRGLYKLTAVGRKAVAAKA